ncbi:ROK family protein [Acholeplasma hippikon]|uniref:ROK family sugar kinase n=1 Tax=Acholeplasma hippikon TaxID=264636 RepID=A0A449BIN1_9MOLU|nr:ROK family protein [Acholeplasma hippikon]VEU82187.1 ROK family sugar kinase [Acholeplasma hippikon]
MKNYLTFDIGGTEIKYGVINENYEIIFKDKFPSQGATSGKLVLDDILFKVSELKGYEPQGIAISSAGVINSDTGEVLSATDAIKGYIGMNIVDYIGKETGLNVSVINDVNAMALCESTLGVAKDSKVTVCMTVGTGIGGAIVLNNQIFQGVGYNAGEFGLMKIGDHKYESLAATSALVKQAQELFGNQIQNGIDVFKLYDEKNPLAVNLVNRFYDHLSVGIANLAYALNPDLFVIGGGITARDSFVEELNVYVQDKLTKHLKRYTKVAAAQFRNDAGMIGAFVHFKNTYKI